MLLESPRARGATLRVIEGFFGAIRRESVHELGQVVSADATIFSGPGTSAEPVTKVWAARFRRLDYEQLAVEQLYRADELGFFSAGEITKLAALRRFELSPNPGEVLAVVIPRDRARQSGPRRFGRRMEFVLGATSDGLRIKRVFEDFRLP